MKDIVIIGGGRLGTALGRALTDAGMKVKAVADGSPAAAGKALRSIGCGFATSDLVGAARAGQVLFLCVPDSAIAGVAEELAASDIDWRGKLVFHCSGLLSSSVLGPLRRRGARTASSHPAQSFPAKGTKPFPFRGIHVGVEGQAQAIIWLRPVLRSLGAEPFRLRPGDKPLYHAACSLASNHIVALLDVARGLLQDAGFSKKKALAILLPLAEGTLHNVNKVGTEAALTGPIVRGDIATVEKHLAVLRRKPRVREVYKALGLLALSLAEKSLGPAKVRALKRLLAGK